MNTVLAQLIQWPPTSTTVHGIAVLGALVSYWVTGSWDIAGGIAAVLAVVLPQDATAINKGVQDAREIATAPKP